MVLNKNPLFMVFLVVGYSLLLTGCLNQKTTPEKMHEVMEQVVKAETAFAEQQEPLVQAEKKEKVIYDQILALGMKEHDQIVKLSDEALAIVAEREMLISKETDSIKGSKVQFEKLSPYIKQLDEPEMRKEAEKLYKVMMDRYELHNDLVEAYTQAILLDKELYQMFKMKDLSLEALEIQINQINDSYKKVFQINENFNLNTKEYNELKLAFYQQVGFKTDNNQ